MVLAKAVPIGGYRSKFGLSSSASILRVNEQPLKGSAETVHMRRLT